MARLHCKTTLRMKKVINIFFAGLLSGLLFSCNDSNSRKVTSVEKVKIENNGVSIDYEDSKIGDTTLLFVHGWGINKTYWANQFDFFSKKYRVVTVDLAGFGKSGKNRKNWTVEEFAKDVSAILTGLDLKNVILVGHSMSGSIIVETAINNPARVIGIIGVDNFKNLGVVETPQSKEEAVNFYKAVRANYKEIVSEYVNQALFSPSTDSLIRKRVLNDILNSDSVIAVDCLEQGDKYQIDEKLKSLKRKLYLINSDFAPTDTLVFKKNNIDYNLFDIGATGHYPMLEKPDDFNSLLEKAIKEIGNKLDKK